MAKEIKMTPASKGHAPKGAHGRAAVHALGRTKTTGNFKKIEAAHGKGAAIAAYQNKLAARKHNGPKAHVAGGMHFGAHVPHDAITAQTGCCFDCEKD